MPLKYPWGALERSIPGCRAAEEADGSPARGTNSPGVDMGTRVSDVPPKEALPRGVSDPDEAFAPEATARDDRRGSADN